MQCSHLWIQQNNQCFYCLRIIYSRDRIRRKFPESKVLYKNIRGFQHELQATIDHVIPRSILNRTVYESIFDNDNYRNNPNLVLACYSCNKSKDNKIPKEWDGRFGLYLYTENGWEFTNEFVGQLNLQMGKVTW